jgi:hypothetical protein
VTYRCPDYLLKGCATTDKIADDQEAILELAPFNVIKDPESGTKRETRLSIIVESGLI